jgi:hypothetical protein
MSDAESYSYFKKNARKVGDNKHFFIERYMIDYLNHLAVYSIKLLQSFV